MFTKIKEIVLDINLKELADFEVENEGLIYSIENILKWLDEAKIKRNIEYVKGI